MIRVLVLLLVACALTKARQAPCESTLRSLQRLRDEQSLRLQSFYKEQLINYEMHHLELVQEYEKRRRGDTQTDPGDKEALVSLYKATNGAQWFNNSGWKDMGDPCNDKWFGIYCENSRVTYISLVTNGLVGQLPDDFGNLNELQNLFLYSNQLTGDIPASLWGIKSLQACGLTSNELSGTLPSVLDLQNLTFLAMDNNQLTGYLPTTWNTPKLKNLTMSSNQFTGPLPSDIGNCKSLEQLILSRNNLTGGYPISYGQLTNLVWLWLFDNFVTGPFPDSWESLTKLQTVELQQMTGTIPDYIGTSWQDIQLLVLARGQLMGEIPTSLCNLKQLQTLWLFQNNLTGQIPSCMSSMVSLTDLELATNQLTGPIPTDIGNLVNLQRLNLNDNSLSGSIPSSIGNLKNCEAVSVCQNSLTGEVPSSLASLKGSLYELGLCYNKLSTFGSGLEDFLEFLGNYGCEFYSNPWECPIPSYVPKSCDCVCSECNTGSKHSSCSACVADSTCGWCSQGPNCLEGDQSGPQGYPCSSSDWTYGGNSCP